MSAEGIQVLAVTIGPYNPTSGTQLTQLSGSNGYTLNINAVSTLVPDGSALGGQSRISGLFYVPALLPDDAHLCDNATQIPQAVIDKSNQTSIPNVSKVALAPWGPPDCQLALFRAVARTAPNVFAFLTYLPDGSTNPPPALNDPSWNLGDGGAWTQNSVWPIYAVNGQTGATLMDLLNNYTSVPDVDKDVAWVDAIIAVDNANGFSVLPDLWTIVLAVLAAFIVVLASISGILHLLQRKRRRDLHRRILSGEVALEDIGIRKLTVPQELMDKMPVRKYGSLAGQIPITTPSDAITEKEAVASPAQGQSATSSGAAMLRHYNQPTCPICLDDFAADADVRCLPCDHIFHPECCDAFLRENSSLCPMCKKSVLPRGYCPAKITNAMVRREQLARMRARGELNGNQQQLSSGAAARVRGFFPGTRNGTTESEPNTVEMTTPAPQITVPISPSDLPPPAPAPGLSSADNCTPGRREWARRRALQLLGNHATTTEEEEIDRAARIPAWRRAIAKIFPNSSSV